MQVNKKYIPWLSIFFWLQAGGTVTYSQTTLPVINEVVSANITGIPDEYETDVSNCPVPDCVQWYQDLGESVYDGDYPDWIELYNPGADAIQLAGYGLSDDPARPFKWTFPEIVLAPGDYLVVFASGKNKHETYLHTNFKLDRGGETIVLTDNSGVRRDEIETGEIPVDFSLGRKPDGGSQWVVFAEPTPGESNTPAAFPGFTDVVVFSHTGGFYAAAFALNLSSNDPSSEILFTTNGSEPTRNSNLYTNPIQISKTTVVRARTYKDDLMSSQIMTQTYFINERFTLPVVSLSSNPENLWDQDLGIYVPGRNANESVRVANYWNDWERPVHVEFYETGGSAGFSIDAGMKIFGWGSRINAQKSLAIMIRDKYGFPELDYPLFPNFTISKFKAFVLRAGGNDWDKTMLRDPFSISLVADKNLDYQAFRPAIVFINGQYWGIHDIREKLNEDYLASHHGVDKDNVDIISRYWRRTYPVIVEGDDAAFLELENFLQTHDMRQPENYAYIKSVVDIDNLLDYMVPQIYVANYDWPGNNNKNWKEKSPGAKWRWLLYDLDYTFNSNGNNGYTHNTLVHTTSDNPPGWPNPGWTNLVLRKILINPEFQIDFVNRMADFMNTSFREDRALARLDEMIEIYRPEMPAQIQRWGAIPSIAQWDSNLNEIATFLRLRQLYVRIHFRDAFGLSGWDKLKLTVTPANAGRIGLNSIVVEAFPWEGAYFKDVPIKISALPNPGYRFAGWTGVDAANQSAASVTITLTGQLAITANFEEDQPLAVKTASANQIPKEVTLYRSYPNPFNPVTVISYSLPEAMQVKLAIFNTLGQRVAELVNEVKQAGLHHAEFDASALSSGIYLFRLEAGTKSLVNRMVYLR